ncbi:methyltransferase domain-containing protein [Oscillatoria sp. FACHB-1407]|uniref:methyltransferase domain-containing protein n=1 Tax=Oscillatoria sp. FACHB-1407 TaxID=2692847 RepID=UPI001689DEAC|nr:methyltransferase domain-containing protein [Oscillatoria sp. FACHB-1407]MBD2464516.1 methyltransferase domain-containing protein [Oscillatoria sp. FACHB-1407]
MNNTQHQQAIEHFRQGRYAEAIDLYEQYLDEENSDEAEPSQYWYLGMALLLHQQPLEAEAIWLSAIAPAHPDQVDALVQDWARTLFKEAFHFQTTNQLPEAELLYQQILQQIPNSAETYENLAIVLVGQGKLDEVEVLVQSATELQDEHPELAQKINGLLQYAKDNPVPKAIYKPEVFYVDTLDAAKGIILTPEEGTTTEERWQIETPYLAEQLGLELHPKPNDLILDFGCGIGRLAKEVINRYDCLVLGVDMSQQMLQFAIDYVASPKFMTCSPVALDRLIQNGLRVDHAYSTWVIQHCHDPHLELARIKQVLKPGGRFYIVNAYYRCVPSNLGWVDDDIDVAALLRSEFQELSCTALPEAITTPELAQNCFCMTVRKKEE